MARKPTTKETAVARLRAASYTRVSTKTQADEGLSLDAQQARVSEHIERQGWQLAESYVERGVSGKLRERPELDRLLANLDSFDVLVIPKLDRLGRGYVHMTEVKGKLDDAGVALVCLDPQIDFSTTIGLLVWANLTALAQVESENTSERVTAVAITRAERGGHNGGPRPYGYEHRDGDLIVVPDEALIVRRMFDRFLAGQSQRRIANDLAADGVPTLKGKWNQSTVSRILRAPLYRGQVTLNGEVYPGTHTAIIDDATWEKVAELRAATTRTKLAGRGKPSKRFLLTRGHLRCGCGASMVVRSDSDKYECAARKANVEACAQRPIKRTRIDGALVSYFMTVGLDVEATRAQLAEAIERQAAEVRSLREQAERQEQAAAEAMTRLRRDYKAGELSASDWSDFRDELTTERQAAKAEAARLRRQEQAVADAAELHDVEADALRQLADLRAAIAGEVIEARGLPAVRAALLRLFARFTLTPATAEAPPTTDDQAILDAVDLDDDFLVWAEPRATALIGLDENWLPVLTREALHGDRQYERDGFAM